MSQRPTIVPRSGHPISRRDIDPDCLMVLQRLHRSGHYGYLVGGGVRDLLLGVRPKDFDVATDASPQRIRRLFRNCVLVGRRFRLAHVRFGTHVIEVSTFRQAPRESEDRDGEDLLIRQDNTFGSPEDDARRRDFTINALFYDIGTFSIIDYVGGLVDIEDHVVRSIGDPRVRYREDPVRMIRAAKFAARLDFEVAEADREAIEEFSGELKLASIPRLLEEIFKLLRSGSTASAFKLMADFGLLDVLLPEVARHLERTEAARDPESAPFYKALFALDDHVRSGGAGDLPNAVLLAAMFLPLVEERLGRMGQGLTCWAANVDQVAEAFEAAVRPLLRHFTVSRRDSEALQDAVLLQPRLAQGPGQDEPLPRWPSFPEAVAVLGLGSALHPELAAEFDAWHALAVEAADSPHSAQRSRTGRVRRTRRRS